MVRQPLIVTSKTVNVPNRQVQLSGYFMIRGALMIGCALASFVIAEPVAREAYEVYQAREGDDLSKLLEFANQSFIYIAPLLILTYLGIAGVFSVGKGLKLKINRGIPTSVSTKIPNLKEAGDLETFLERREWIQYPLPLYLRMLLSPLIKGADDLSAVYRNWASRFKIRRYMLVALLLSVPEIMRSLGMLRLEGNGETGVELNFFETSLTDSVQPWIVLAAIGLAGLMTVVVIRLSGSHAKQLDIEENRTNSSSAGNPIDFWDRARDLIENRPDTDFHSKVYREEDPEIGKTSFQQTDQFQSSLLMETYPKNVETVVRGPARVSLSFALLLQGTGLAFLAWSPILVAATIYNVVAVLLTVWGLCSIARHFAQFGVALATLYRFESEVYLLYAKGTYGSALVASDPNSQASGNRSMLDCTARTQVYSARIISESVNRSGYSSPRYLVDAVSSPEYERNLKELLHFLKAPRMLGSNEGTQRLERDTERL